MDLGNSGLLWIRKKNLGWKGRRFGWRSEWKSWERIDGLRVGDWIGGSWGGGEPDWVLGV